MVNGGAETGDTTGWHSSTGIIATMGDAWSQGFGNYSFTGEFGPAVQSLTQTIDLSGNAAQIDSGLLNFDFSVQLQGRTLGSAVDRAYAELFFRDTNGTTLTSYLFEDTNTPSNVFDWDLYSATDLVAMGTRSVDIVITSTRNSGSSSDGFIDNVSFSVSPVPEPATYALMLGGLGLVGLFAARRNKA